MKAQFAEQGVCEDSREHAVNSVVETSLRGVDSHGIHLFPHYHRAVAAGRINSSPDIKVLRQSESTAAIDADHAFGHHAGSVAIKLAQDMALVTGIAAVNVGNSTHFGAAGYFALQASRNDFIAFSFTNADALVKAANATVPFFGTNPVCFTAPLASEEPLCLDMATSRVSWNRIRNHQQRGEILLSSWADDSEGQPTTDPQAARMLEAIGDYKGFGLGMMVEVLCGCLAGGPVGRELLPMFTSPIEARREISHFFMVLHIEAILPMLSAFKVRLQAMVDEMRSLGPTVMAPGDPEKTSMRERLVSGIPIEEEVFAEFLAVSPRFEGTILK